MATVIIGIFSVDHFAGNESPIPSTLLIPVPVFVLACATALVSLTGYLLHVSQKPSHLLSLASYVLLGATVSYLVVVTGVTASPFIGLWMLVAVFIGVFGVTGISLAIIAVNGYLLSQIWFGQMPTKEQLVVYVLAAELPIIASYLIWPGKSKHENDKDKAFNALAAELTEVSDKSQIVINAIADGVIAIDNSGIIQLINPAAQEALGWAQNDALNLDYKSVLKLADKKGDVFNDAANPVQQVLSTNKTLVDNDVTLLTNSGKQIMISLVVSPAGLHGSGAIVVFRDITKQKSEEKQQAEFISTASHEMRTPVASIEGYLGLALNPATATIDEKARQYLTKAHESARHLGRLFQDLLDITKVEDGRISNNPGIIDMVAYTGDIVSGFEVKAKEKGLVLLYKPGYVTDTGNDLSKKLSPVFYTKADADHLREVISNLTDNAIKYTPRGSVTIDVSGDDTSVTISISDSGIGIPPEDVNHLFQKFYRVDNTATREIGGTGLGLYLCRRLVETMNGKIWVESTFGKGSTFFIQFTRVSHEDAMAQLEAATTEETQPTPTITLDSRATPVAPAQVEAQIIQTPQPPAATPAAPVQSQVIPQPVATTAQPITPAQAQTAPQPVYAPQAIDQPIITPRQQNNVAYPVNTAPTQPVYSQSMATPAPPTQATQQGPAPQQYANPPTTQQNQT